MEFETKTRKWGSSLGLVIPKEIVEETGLKPNQKIVIDLKRRPLAGELFGKFPNWGKSSQELKDEMRKGWLSASDLAHEKSQK